MAPPRIPTLPVNSDFGPYHLLRVLGVGGMAEVYLARTKGVAGFERLLALKVISPTYAEDGRVVRMLVDEARLAIGLNHPNIAQTFDLGRIGEIYFISMEYVDGVDYFKLLTGITDQDADVPLGLALYVARQICLGLDYAHRKLDERGEPMHIIHRDVSPQNVLLSRQGAVKLVDFGIAKAANMSGDTSAGTIKGKLVYMSPEQARGEDVDQRADIFSAGIVLYESLTGGSLYLEQNPVNLIKLVRKAELLPPSSRNGDIPLELDALVMKALAPRRESRYQTALELADAITRFMEHARIEHSAAQLAGMVAAILDNEQIDGAHEEETSPRWASGPLAGAMDRADYAGHGHSVIFSAAALDAAPGTAAPGEGPLPTGARPTARVVLLGEAGEETHAVGDDFIIGRGGELRLLNARVSRRHARITFSGGRYLLADLNSSNGTFLNEEKLAAPRALRSSDVIRIGPFELRFFIDEPAAAPAPAPPFASAPSAAVGPRRDDVQHEQPAMSQLSVSHRSQPAAPGGSAGSNAPVPGSEDWTGPTGSAALVVEDGPRAEQLVIPLERNLVLDERIGVGELHLGGAAGRLLCQGDGYFLEPLPGRDPVLLNGQPIRETVRLDDGDVVLVGPITARFRAR